LIQLCRSGDQHAWGALVDKYKRLIYSVPYRYRLSPEDCADIFQAVCLELFSELDNIRQPEALRGWLLTVTARKCQEWKARHTRGPQPAGDDAAEQYATDEPTIAEVLEEAARDQDVREAVERLPPRCQELIRLLFYSQPPLPYEAVAQRLGLATGSVGFIRGRCLKRLKKMLEEKGV
jgi:RNA polymerase sigma factor (sigma-70 family)